MSNPTEQDPYEWAEKFITYDGQEYTAWDYTQAIPLATFSTREAAEEYVIEKGWNKRGMSDA